MKGADAPMSDALVEARRLLGLVTRDLQGRIEGGKLAALMTVRDRIDEALSAQGALREAPEVTDEMVERAMKTYAEVDRGLSIRGMRAALTASLASAPQPTDWRKTLEDIRHAMVTSNRLYATDRRPESGDWFQIDNDEYITALDRLLPPGPYVREPAAPQPEESRK